MEVVEVGMKKDGKRGEEEDDGEMRKKMRLIK